MIDIYKIINKLMNPPVSRDSGGFWFLDWNESGFEMRIYEEVFEAPLSTASRWISL